MSDCLQGGYNVHRGYFEFVLQNMKQSKSRCLDLGSGTFFNFERLLLERRSEMQDEIDCIDIQPFEFTLPSGIKSYEQRSLEEAIEFKYLYDYVFCFEVIEHVDNTDMVFKNICNALKPDGLLFFSVPNLASFFGRMEILFGYLPHQMEISNENPNAGTGFMGRANNKSNTAIHHIRVGTYKAYRELLEFHGFEIVKVKGISEHARFLELFPGLSSSVLYMCRKNK